MNKSIRCKFLCESVTKRRHWDQSKGEFLYAAKFHPVSGGSDENKAFFAATPVGSLEIADFNADSFQPGREYYVDLTLVELMPA